MKKLQIAILAISLTAAMSASATITYSGTALSGLTPATPYGPATDSQYVPASGSTPALWALYTYDSGDLDTSGDTPAVFVQMPVAVTLSSFVASYQLYGAATGPSGTSPYWNLYLTDDPGYTSPIVGGGSTLNGSSIVQVGPDATTETLSALDAMIDPISGLPYGQETVAWAGVEIGNWDNGTLYPVPASANIESITIGAVPEPTTMVAGALLLLPFGASTLRILRKRTA
jgi:hypothetical protein